jgi:hypothetical protein
MTDEEWQRRFERDERDRQIELAEAVEKVITKGFDASPLLERRWGIGCIRAIRDGILLGVDVSLFARDGFNGERMGNVVHWIRVYGENAYLFVRAGWSYNEMWSEKVNNHDKRFYDAMHRRMRENNTRF